MEEGGRPGGGDGKVPNIACSMGMKNFLEAPRGGGKDDESGRLGPVRACGFSLVCC